MGTIILMAQGTGRGIRGEEIYGRVQREDVGRRYGCIGKGLVRFCGKIVVGELYGCFIVFQRREEDEYGRGGREWWEWRCRVVGVEVVSGGSGGGECWEWRWGVMGVMVVSGGSGGDE